MRVTMGFKETKGLGLLDRMASGGKGHTSEAVVYNSADHARMVEYGGRITYRPKSEGSETITVHNPDGSLDVIIYNKSDNPTPKSKRGTAKGGKTTVRRTADQTVVIYKPYGILRKTAVATRRRMIRAAVKNVMKYGAGKYTCDATTHSAAAFALTMAVTGSPKMSGEFADSWGIRYE